MASTVMQVYLKVVLESFFNIQSQVRIAALSVINLVLRQGLVHPVQVSNTKLISCIIMEILDSMVYWLCIIFGQKNVVVPCFLATFMHKRFVSYRDLFTCAPIHRREIAITVLSTVIILCQSALTYKI